MTITHDVTDSAHRSRCGECATLWMELDAISAQAAQLQDLAPSRDLWAGIEARLGEASSHTADRSPRAAHHWFGAPPRRLAMAASLLIAVTATVTWRVARGPAAPTDLAAVAVPNDAAGALHLASLTASVTQMDREIAALQVIVAERRDALDPQTVAVLETNLQIIDAAIAESRAALAADPASQFLATQVTRAYDSKLTLLRDAATLPTGI